MSHVVSARLGDELYDSVEKIAYNRHRKISEVLQEALVYYVKYFADYQLALERLHDPSDEIIDEKELLRRLKWSDE